jgi:hypothetical protein
MNNLQIILILISLLSSCKDRPDIFDSNISDISIPDTTIFNYLVSKYAESIDKADIALGAKLWSHMDETSFINPRGHEHGWDRIKNIHIMFRDNFSERKLSCYNLKTSVYNDFAWLEFYGTFDAVRKPENIQTQTRGRDTQIWRKINTEWRLIHVHYSGMPVTGPGEGF